MIGVMSHYARTVVAYVFKDGSSAPGLGLLENGGPLTVGQRQGFTR